MINCFIVYFLGIHVNKTTHRDYSTTYSDFIVERPKRFNEGLPFYQEEAQLTIKNILKQYNAPEYLPEVSQMVSEALVLCAEHNLKISNKKPKDKKLLFSRN